MQPVTCSWIGLSAAAPLAFLLNAWVAVVLHHRRRPFDLLLQALFVQEVLMALMVFAFSLYTLMARPGAACSAFVWSVTSCRVLQQATVASLLADRALAAHAPFKYRGVRRHQVRYHLGVVAVMAALVGVAALLVRPHEEGLQVCSFLPHALDIRLSLFLLSLNGLLVGASVFSAAVLLTSQSNLKGRRPSSSMTKLSPPSNASTMSSVASSSRHFGTYVDMSFQAENFDWIPAVSVSVLCFIFNHLPYVVLTTLGTFFPTALNRILTPEWPSENVALWLSVAESLVLPLVLTLADGAFRKDAASPCHTEKPSHQPPHKFDDGSGPFRLYMKEEVKSFPLTNGSLFSSMLNMTLDSRTGQPTFLQNYKRGLRMGISSSQEIRGFIGTSQHGIYGGSSLGSRTFSLLGNSTDLEDIPTYSSPLQERRVNEEEDHIYATLSETLGSTSSYSSLSEDDQRCSSATTAANDDFEFHTPCRQNVNLSLQKGIDKSSNGIFPLPKKMHPVPYKRRLSRVPSLSMSHLDKCLTTMEETNLPIKSESMLSLCLAKDPAEDSAYTPLNLAIRTGGQKGIVTIRAPAELSVGELLRIINSHPGGAPLSSSVQKIFVSEYI